MSKKKELKVFEYEGKRITFDFGDGDEMINATEIAKAFGKRLEDFTRLKQTKKFIEVLENSMNSKDSAKPADLRVWKNAVKSIRGGNDPSIRGTWYEQRLALKLAAWLSPEFELWIYDRIRELLTLGETKIDSQTVFESDKIKTLEFVFQKIKDNAMEIHHLSDILDELKKD